MQKSNTTAIVGVVIFGIIAIGLTFYALSSGGNSPEQPGNISGNGNATTASAETAIPQSYFVASQQILPRTKITRNMLVERQSDGEPVPENAITDPFQVVGKLANKIIQPGQIFTAGVTVQPVSRVVPANIPVPAGLRAIAVWVNPTETTAGLVDVGDRVDILATHELKAKTTTGENTEFVSGRTIAQDLQVLAVDRSIQAAKAGAPEGDSKKAATAKPEANAEASRTRVIVAASPTQAQRIAAANESGIIHLTIRNPGDSVIIPTGEAWEYPVHVVADTSSAPESKPSPRPNNRNRNDGNSPSTAELMELIRASRPPQNSTPPALPNPGNTTSIPDLDQVTVIRGTEKTQVAVQ